MRTTHNATSHNTGPRPYVERGEAHVTVPGRGAETSDRLEREAGRSLKSAYAHIVALPSIVAPGDLATASAILRRIEGCLDRGGWTGGEGARLRAMRDAWERRAHGRDIGFKLRGWRKKGTGHNTPAFEKFTRAVQEEVKKCGYTSKTRGF